MNLDSPINENYAVTVVRVHTLTPLPGLDNLVGLPVHGMQALVPKDTPLGSLGIVIPTEAQVSEDFARENNLYRHAELNADPEKTGYLDDNRRVRAIKLRGHRSSALFLPIDSLAYIGLDLSTLDEGDTFDALGGLEVVRKFVIREPRTAIDRTARKHERAWRRVDEKMLPEHIDTDNWWKNQHTVPADARLIITQKLHGTSIRIGNTIVKRQLTWLERILDRFGLATIAKTEHAVIGGSRKVIKDRGNDGQQHYYGTDLWSDWAEQVGPLLPENYIVYGEVIGWVGRQQPIQRGYTYEMLDGHSQLYVYRVAVINEQGRLIDLTWEQVKSFCAEVGLMHVPELDVTTRHLFWVEDYMDRNYSAIHGAELDDAHGFTDRPVALPKGTVDEGVVIRVEPKDGGQPWFLKAKSPAFFEHETKMLDKGIVDVESAEAAAA